MSTPNKKIFCNSPWYELQIYQDGGLGVCCQEDHRLYNTQSEEKYNIANISILDWFNSEPIKKMRMDMWGNKKLSICTRCMKDEEAGVTSRRHKSNQKSVIFTRSAFEDSIIQSPNYDYFLYSKKNQGTSQTLPIDFHIDLGNYCNLACKMCHSQSSSRIAAQQVEWGNLEHKKYLGLDWTKNEKVWNSFLQQMLKIKLQNIHFM